MKKLLTAVPAMLALTFSPGYARDTDLFARLDSFVVDGRILAVWDACDTIPWFEVPVRLTERDYEDVARELDVDVPAIKAVVEIEAGRTHQGFWTEGKPLINFDLSMYRRFAQRNGVNLAAARKKSPVIFRSPDNRKYGSRQAAQQARLDAAMAIDSLSAAQGTFWGMFQIGGFNYRKCGAESIGEFIDMMSHSERSQLELFARFIINTGLDKYLRAHNWSAFARGYNGPGYARRGYHTRLASAYRRHNADSKPVRQ